MLASVHGEVMTSGDWGISEVEEFNSLATEAAAAAAAATLFVNTSFAIEKAVVRGTDERQHPLGV